MDTKFLGLRAFSLLAIVSAYSAASAVELIANGDFEAGATGWSLGGLSVVGDYSGTDVGQDDGVNGPSTSTTWLGGYDDAFDTTSQVFDTGVGPGTLDFDLYVVSNDDPTFDFFYVYIDATELLAVDLGDYGPDETLAGPIHHTIDVTAFMDGNSHDLQFIATSDFSLWSSAFVDNVSIQGVPEPATMAALGLGSLALLRKRRRN